MMYNPLLRMKPLTAENYLDQLRRVCKESGIKIEDMALALHDEMNRDPAKHDNFLEKLEQKGMLSGISWKMGMAVYDNMFHARQMEKEWRANPTLTIQDVIKRSRPSYFEWRRSKSPMMPIIQFLYSAHRSSYNTWSYAGGPPPYYDTNVRDRTNLLRNLASTNPALTMRLALSSSIVNMSDRSILVGAGLVGSGANPAGCMAGNGTYGAVNYNDWEMGLLVDTGTGYSKFQFALTSAGSITPTTAAIFGATYVPCWIFTCTIGTTIPTAGATYTNNGVTFTVKAAFVSGSNWIIIATAAAWTASGSTLTKATGTGDSTITFSASQGAANTTTYTIKNAVPSLAYVGVLPSAQVAPPSASGSALGYQALALTGGTGDAVLLYNSHSTIYQLYYQDDLSLNGITATGSSGSGSASWSFQRLFQNLSAGNVTVSESGISANSGYNIVWVKDAAPTSFTAVTLAPPQVLMTVYQNSLAL